MTRIPVDRVIAAGLLTAALILSLLLGGCAHARAIDRALNQRCLAACEGWGGPGVVALCDVRGGCACQSWAGDMVYLEGVCPRRLLVRR